MSVFVSALIAFSDPLIALAAPSAAITLGHTFAARAALAASEAASAAGTGLRRRKQTIFYKPGNNTMETPESVALPGYLDATKYMPEENLMKYETVLSADFDGVFKFTNWSNEESAW